ncbi:MAG: class II aldolase/adducin family protein [Deltaproteobacteria bacterium]|nr:class II aldolase/adducin family protein [Deltaproteobacteria bacterium]
MNERTLRESVADCARLLHARGWVANHDGNVTARVSNERFLATPTALSKARVTGDNLLVVDARGEKIAGAAKPFGEVGLHMTVYRHRADVRAVVHAHPPCASALACAGSRLLERPFMPEAVVSLGATIPTVPLAPPGAAACDALAPFVVQADAVLLQNHGVLSWGDDVEQAYLRMELVEHLAKIALEAERVGGVKALPDSVLSSLLEARRKAGLGLAQKPAPRVVACAPPPTDAPVEIVTPRPEVAVQQLESVIREEIVRALSKK